MADQPGDEGNVRNLPLTLQFLKIYWKIIFAISWALLLIPIILVNNVPETRCAYAILLMAGYWVTECFPMAMTSLLPVVLFPLFGILSSRETCGCYANDTIMVFIGGLVLAVAIEHSKLHMRIALTVMKYVGCTHARLLGGLCAVTAFISMWVSNTAATAMMIPIIFAILNELEQAGLGRVFDQIPNPESPNEEPEVQPTRVTRAYLLATAYCSTFGGTSTIVGTGTNLTFKGIFENTFPTSSGINFSQWMLAMLPQMIVNTAITWLYIRIMYLGYLRPNSKDAEMANIGAEGEAITNRVVLERYKALGKMSFHEVSVAILFVSCIFLWIFRSPGFVQGWAEVVTQVEVRDSTPVIFISVLMFFIPRDPSFIYFCSKDPSKRPKKCSDGLITWDVIQKRIPWSLMFLLGGGFAISRGSISSCLAKRLGEALVPLKALPPILILVVVSAFIGTITEFTTNVGIANITLPVIAQMCVAMELNPLYLMIPATTMCSFAFRLPVGTPPNALITLVGKLQTKWLIIGGCIPAIYSLITQSILFVIWGSYVFNTNLFPEWAANIQSSASNPQCS